MIYIFLQGFLFSKRKATKSVIIDLLFKSVSIKVSKHSLLPFYLNHLEGFPSISVKKISAVSELLTKEYISQFGKCLSRKIRRSYEAQQHSHGKIFTRIRFVFSFEQFGSSGLSKNNYLIINL